MPLLNKKRITFTTPIDVDTRRRRKQVYYLKCTNEAFSTYESYIKRWTLCHRPLWECERTGRQHLTYQQAKESEQADQHRVEFKFCAVLRKQLLSHIQFQTTGLDALVQHLFTLYLYDFATGEVILCFLNGHTYLGEIVGVMQNPNHVVPAIKKETNGRLRFPDAFLHPEPTAATSTTADSSTGPDHQYRYKVQLINSDGSPLEQGVRILEADELCRDPQWFNPTMLRRLVRECATRDGYIGAPWLLKDNVAKHYGIPTTLPTPLKESQDMAYYDLIRQRQPQLPLKYHSTEADYPPPPKHQQHQHQPLHNEMTTNGTWSILHPRPSPSLSPTTTTTMTTPTNDSITFSSFNQLAREEQRHIDKQARKQEHLRLKIQQKLEKERIREERKKQAAVKYPIEDLDLPIYRKDPYRHWALVDMTPTSYSHGNGQLDQQQEQQQQVSGSGVRIPYPCGGRGPHPQPHFPSPQYTDQHFESMLAIWSFLTVFSVPLELPTMTIETFESSLLSTSPPPVLIHSFVSLLNVIIKERLQGTTSDIINGDQVEEYLQDNESSSSDEQEEEEEEEKTPTTTITTARQTRQSTRTKVETPKAAAASAAAAAATVIEQRTEEETFASGWRDPEPLRLCKDWDKKEIKADRTNKNWLVALIGCLNDVATPLLLPEIDGLLRHLIPRPHSTIAERDRQFASLDAGSRLLVLSFLVDATNETLIIKNYMDKCQDQMTELRRQKVELNKEYKQLALSKPVSEKKQPGRKSDPTKTTDKKDDTTPLDDEMDQQQANTSDVDEEDEGEIDDDDDDQNDDDDDSEHIDTDDEVDDDEELDDDDDDEEEPSDDDEFATGAVYTSEDPNEKHPGKRKSKYGALHQSRRLKLEQKKSTESSSPGQPGKRRRLTKKQPKSPKTTPATKPNEPSPLLNEAPPPLENKEQELKRKEEQLEREMRQYTTLRIRPLGKDRFFQRYFYLDNIGTPDHHGTGRLYVQSPTYVDILQLMDRDHHPSSNGVVSGPSQPPPPEQHSDTITPAWGRGGGREFVLALMKEQGLTMECEWLATRMDELQQQQDTLLALRPQGLSHPMCRDHPVLANHLHHHEKKGSWWYYYSDPEQIQLLLGWLNPKGVREYKLRNEIIKQQHFIVESMEKHEKPIDEVPPSNRATRGKKP